MIRAPKEQEIWKDVPGYEGIYQASSFGQVKSLDRISSDGRRLKGKILSGGLAGSGYKTTSLCNGKQKTYPVHQLIAIVFLDHIPCGLERVVDHKDNNKLNNRADNLQIISNRENVSKDKTDVGVCFIKAVEKWKVTIYYKGKDIYLGSFKEKQKALDRYQKALAEITNGTSLQK